MEDEKDVAYLLDNVPKAVERAIDGLSRVTEIVRSMKSFAHPDSKELVPFDVNEGISSTLVIARNEYKYVADVEAQLEPVPVVLCVPGEINQVFLNLIVNAAHAIAAATEGTGKRGKITVRSALEGGHVVVSIQDTGTGIPENIHAKIFDQFFTTKPVGKGTGQGLAIARTVIARHQGELSFDSKVGEGSTFYVRLPASVEAPLGV